MPTVAITAAAVEAPPERVPADVHNRIVTKALKRADALEKRMVDVLTPILEAAGRDAVAAFRRYATDHLTAAALDVGPDATMVALKPRREEAEALALRTGVPADALHVTLALLGGTDGDLDAVREALAPVAARYAPLTGVVAGGGFFGDPTRDGPEILLPDVRGLVEVRVAATEALVDAGIDYARDHGFQAHVTVAYREGGGEIPASADYRAAVDEADSCATCAFFSGPRRACEMFDASADPVYVCDEWTTDRWPVGAALHFDAILIVRGDEILFELPFVGVPSLTAAGADWTAPFPDQVVDVDALVAEIKAKTDPVRNAFIEAVMAPVLREAGISFDVTNPLAAKALASSGAKITHIADTTRLNAMRIIRSAHDNGLSIPQTADALQVGMSAASPVRATMIARTELAAAVNGGSLAAVSIVGDATGSSYMKRWLTAPGAPFPRHELYEGLDGQTVALEEAFTVGDSELQYPGDPDGDPGESINCRCTLAYDDGSGSGEQEADAESPPDFALGGGDETDAIANASPAAGSVDTVSVNAGPPLPPEVVQRIEEHGLDVPLTDESPPTTAFGRDFAARLGGNNTQAAYAPTGEWDPARRELHQQIIDAHFAGKVSTGDTPTAYFTSGGGASGKSAAPFSLPDGSTLTPKLFSELEAEGTAPVDTVLIDPDRIKLMLPEYATLRDAGDLHAAAFVHEESSALANEIRVEAQRRGLSMLVDTTGSSDGFLTKLGEAKAAGYDVKVTMFSTPTNEAIVRAMARGDKSGRYVSTWALKHAHSGASKQLGIWKDSPLVKEWKVFDNSTRTPTLVAEGGLGKSTVRDRQAFDSILSKATEKSGVPSTLVPDVVPAPPPWGVRIVDPIPGPTVGITAVSRDGFGNSETLANFTTATRDTGHFGTGTYFASDADAIPTLTSDEGRSIVGVDLAGKNLWAPVDEKFAFDAHDALLKIDDLASTTSSLEGRIEELRLEGIALHLPDVTAAMVKTAIESARADLAAGLTNTDSAATRVMKLAGWDGIDVRHLPALDNSKYGSVLYRDTPPPG